MNEAAIKAHWKRFEDYKKNINDPTNEEIVDGFVSVSVPFDPMPSLAALVAAGELEHIDLILPTINHKALANQYWMQVTVKVKEIVYASGNSSYTAFDVAGDPPLQLKLWFRPGAEPQVRELIKNLELLDEYWSKNEGSRSVEKLVSLDQFETILKQRNQAKITP